MDITNKTLHIIPVDLSATDNYLQQYRCVQLKNVAGSRSIHFTIKEVVDELKEIDKKYVSNIKERDLKRKEFLEQFKDIGWIAVVSPKVNDNPNDYEVKKTISSGLDFSHGEGKVPQRRISFSELLVGGGFAYVGAKFPIGSKYAKTKVTGLFYQAFGTPSIVRMEWTDMEGNPLKGKTVQFNSHVLLNIYTKDLYGQELEVYLYDKDRIDPDDLLPIGGKDYFVREVEYRKKDRNTEKRDTIGSLTNSKTNVAEEHSQILSFTVYVDYAWYAASKLGETIKVFPQVKVTNTVNFLEISEIEYLSVSLRGDVVGYQKAPDNNSPVTVYEIETNIAPYHPCGYTSISITEDKREKIVVFDQKKDTVVNNPFELVAGDKQSAVKTIIIELDENASTKECTLKEMQKTTESHEGHVFNIIKYPEKGFAKDNKEEKSSRLSIKEKTETKVGGVGGQGADSYKPENQGLKIFENDDHHIKFEARFLYNREPIWIGAIKLSYLYRYIWSFSESAYQQYAVQIGSCRYNNQLVDLHVYPNLAWAIRLEYTGDGEVKSSRELINNQTYENTRNATFRRQPAKWISAGERNLGIKLETKVINDEDKDDENEVVDISADVIEVIKEKLQPVVKLLDMLKTVINGDGANQDLSPEEQERMNRSRNNVRNLANSNSAEIEERRRIREREQIEKDKRKFENNKRILKSADKNSREYKNAVKSNKNLQRYMDKHHGGLTRSVVGIELTWPDFGLEFEWKRVPVISETHKDKKTKTGFEITGKFEASPIIGARVFLDFLALAQKLHPIALAVVAALDLTMKAIGDGSKIILEFSIEAEIEGTFEGFYNTVTGENSFNTKDRKENDKHLVELGGKLEFVLLAAIHLKTESKIAKVITGTKVQVSGELSFKANAEFTGKSKFYADEEGFYGVPSGKFEGITIVGKASVKGEINDRDGKAMYSVEKELEFSFEAIPASEEKSLEKFYIVKNEK